MKLSRTWFCKLHNVNCKQIQIEKKNHSITFEETVFSVKWRRLLPAMWKIVGDIGFEDLKCKILLILLINPWRKGIHLFTLYF